MKRIGSLLNLGWRRRYVATAALALAAVCTFYVAGAFGDAGNPILGTIKGSVVTHPDGSVTVYVRGQWNWLSHNSDCNFDRAATGVGIIWNDPSGADNQRSISTATRSGTTVTLTTTTAQTFDVGDHILVENVSGGTGFNGTFVVTARDNTHLKYTSAGTGSGTGGTVTDLDVFNGFKVQKSPITAYVGTQTATPGNPVDQMVHPVDRGNQVEGYTSGTWMSTAQGYASNADGDYPSGQQFVDPSPPSPTLYASWKGGCGREPLTATASKDSNPESTGNSCGTTPASTTCSGHPWGSWGYEKNGGLGYSHTYASRSDLTTVCANFYDVHGGGKFNSGKFQLVNGANEITVNGNGDNSVQTNAFNTAQGANCVFFPGIKNTTATTDVLVGSNITDTAFVTGAASNQVTYVQFHLFAPGDPTCTGTDLYPGGRKSVTDSTSVTSDAVQATQAGDYHWTAELFDAATGGNNLDATHCGDTGETSHVNKAKPSIATTLSASSITVGESASDSATLTGATSDAGGTVTYTVYTDNACSQGARDAGTKTVTNGIVPDSNSLQFDSTGTFSWQAVYSGDANNEGATSDCTTETLVVNKAQPSIVTSASAPVTIGESISDTATISGLVSPDGTGSITFTAYAPNADGLADTTCSTSVFTQTVPGVNANGTYGPVSFTPSGVAPQIAGTYEWVASFSGDGNNLSTSTTCGDNGEQSVVYRHPTAVPTGQKVVISDFAKVGSASGTPTGTVDFLLFQEPSSNCTTTPIYDSGPVTLDANGNASTNGAATQPPTLSANATYSWQVSYTPASGSNFLASSSPCGTEQMTISGNTPGVDP
jgi:hypothetical protein